MLAGTSLDVEHELDVLTDQLVNEYNGEIPRVQVADAIDRARREFGQPAITQFLAILIRRRVKAAFKQSA